ncbi:MAG: nitroreductase family protein [Erysipelotrichaceae bacterium]
MNQVLETIMSRRSCRHFTNERVEEEKIELILQAGLSAPSAMNRQSWHFFVLRNKALQHELAHLVEVVLNRPDYHFYNADTLILVSNESDNPHAVADCACAMENMMLAAHSQGVGSVWINQLKGCNQNQSVRAFLQRIGVRDSHNIYAVCALGMPEPVPFREKVIKGNITFIE